MSIPTITPVDIDPRLLYPDDDSEPNRPDNKLCAEPGCFNTVALTPTGRKGKYCSDHSSASKRSGAPTASTKRTGWKKAPEVLQALNSMSGFIAAGVSVLNEEDGRTIGEGMPAVNRALVDLAREDKKLQRILEGLASPGKYGPLVLASAGVVLPILANHGLIPKLSALLGGPDNGKEKAQ